MCFVLQTAELPALSQAGTSISWKHVLGRVHWKKRKLLWFSFSTDTQKGLPCVWDEKGRHALQIAKQPLLETQGECGSCSRGCTVTHNSFSWRLFKRSCLLFTGTALQGALDLSPQHGPMQKQMQTSSASNRLGEVRGSQHPAEHPQTTPTLSRVLCCCQSHLTARM